MALVLDCSLAMAWANPGEQTPATQAVLAEVGATSAWVPSLWRIETLNALMMSLRRKRIGQSHFDETLADFALLPIEVDPYTDELAWTATRGLAAEHNLTAYDAAYLELALRRGLPLATLGKELRKAAGTEGVLLLGL